MSFSYLFYYLKQWKFGNQQLLVVIIIHFCQWKMKITTQLLWNLYLILFLHVGKILQKSIHSNTCLIQTRFVWLNNYISIEKKDYSFYLLHRISHICTTYCLLTLIEDMYILLRCLLNMSKLIACKANFTHCLNRLSINMCLLYIKCC